MDTRSTKRSQRTKFTTGTSFGPFQIPSVSGTVIDLTRDSPCNDLLPTQLVGSSNSRASRGRGNGSVIIFDEIIDIATTPVKEDDPSPKRSCIEETPTRSSKKRLAFSPVAPGCAVCLEKLQFIDPPPERLVMSLQCGHMYCKSCIVPILTESKHCPKCRRKQGIRDIHPLYA